MPKIEVKTDEERKAEKSRRMKLKMMRMPVNDVVLEVQKGYIDLKDFLGAVEERIKLKIEEKKNG